MLSYYTQIYFNITKLILQYKYIFFLLIFISSIIKIGGILNVY